MNLSGIERTFERSADRMGTSKGWEDLSDFEEITVSTNIAENEIRTRRTIGIRINTEQKTKNHFFC